MFLFFEYISLLKSKKGRKKSVESSVNEFYQNLVSNHIPYLESILNAKHEQCDQLGKTVISQDSVIVQEMKNSAVKNAELDKLRSENLQLKTQLTEVTGLLRESEMRV